MTYSKDFMAGWLAGFFDGEGSARFATHAKGKKHTNYVLSVSNTDPALMERCVQFLNALGIGHGMWNYRGRTPNRKPFATLHVNKLSDIVRFAEVVHMAAPHKVAAVEQIVAWSNRKFKWEDDLPAIAAEHAAGKSLRMICKHLGLAPGGHHLMALRLTQAGFPVFVRRTGRPPKVG